MSTRQERIAIFEENKEWRKNTNYDDCKTIDRSINLQRIYWEYEEVEPAWTRYPRPARMILSRKKTVEAAHAYRKWPVNANVEYLYPGFRNVCILNFASSVSPGGGVAQGAQAQEESICRVTTLYFALSHPETAGKFYDHHWDLIRRGFMDRRNTDDIIYTPFVMILRDDAGNERMLNPMDQSVISVITCAAPDLRRTGDRSEYTPTRKELLRTLENRWWKILSVAASNKVDVLILGAFGCGVFANPPEIVVEAFNNVIPYFRNYFEIIEFAVYSPNGDSANYRAFKGIRDIQEAR